jgi:hypothetical protein
MRNPFRRLWAVSLPLKGEVFYIGEISVISARFFRRKEMTAQASEGLRSSL